MAHPIPAGHHTITPHLVIKGAAAAIEFYKKAFGAKENGRMPFPGPDGTTVIGHAELQIGDSKFFLNGEFPQMGMASPLARGGSSVTIHVYVDDVELLYQKAVDAGAKVVMPLADQFWGDRYGVVQDPFGHRWSMASHIKDLTDEEIRKAGAAAMAQSK